MTPPSKHDVEVATASLVTEGGVWLRQADQLEAISRKADGLRLSRLEAGLFQVVLSAYDAAADQLASRCREGHQRMTEIGVTLRQVAEIYQDEDDDNAHRLRGLY